MDVAVVGISFLAVVLVELPDKTFVAALVLSTRYRGRWVWIGVGLAFLVQTVLAVTVGGVVVGFLPKPVVLGAAVVTFLIGALLMIRAAPGPEVEATEATYGSGEDDAISGLAAIGASFLVLFAAEWGDLSQLLTISLVGRYHHPASVFVGAWAALLVVSGLAVLVGRLLLRYVRLSVVHFIGAGVCLLLAGVTGYELIGIL